jgi:hypothetical protein
MGQLRSSLAQPPPTSKLCQRISGAGFPACVAAWMSSVCCYTVRSELSPVSEKSFMALISSAVSLGAEV